MKLWSVHEAIVSAKYSVPVIIAKKSCPKVLIVASR